MGNSTTKNSGEITNANAGGASTTSLVPQAEGCFGLSGSWRPKACLAVLDALYHVPCLCECILGTQVDPSCRQVDSNAILQMQMIFDARSKAKKDSIIPADQFYAALLSSQIDSIIKDFDPEDPTHVYNAISHLIVTTLPDLRGIFYDHFDKFPDRSKPKSVDKIGVAISLTPDFLAEFENEIRAKRLPRPKALESSPVFVVTTALKSRNPSKTQSYPLSFTHTVNLSKLTGSTSSVGDRGELSYQLFGVVAENVSSKEVRSFFRSVTEPDIWFESGNNPSRTSVETINAMGNKGSSCCVRVLIYIQSDLSSMLTSAGAQGQLASVASTIKDKNPKNGDASKNGAVAGIKDKSVGSDGKSQAVKKVGSAAGDGRDNRASIGTASTGIGSGDVVPMDEDDDEMDDDDYEDIDDDEEYDEDDSEYDDDEEYDEGDDRRGACQCPTCRREREIQAREDARRNSEKEAQDRERRRRLSMPTGPGTRTVAFKPTCIEDGERVILEKGYTWRDIFLQSITAMEGYASSSVEELRFEDYVLEKPPLAKVKKYLDAELSDRAKEAINRAAMEKDEENMRKWAAAADRAWEKFELALNNYKEGLLEQASELCTLALRICATGKHCSGCYYYRARCTYPRDMSKVAADLEQAIALDGSHAEAYYWLGSVLLKQGMDWELAEARLEKAALLNPALFEGQPERQKELEVAREKAARQRLVNAAEAQKSLGNAALARNAYTEAERLYSNAIEICPDGDKSYIYYCNRAAARCEIGTKLDTDPEVGYRTIQTAIEDCEKSLQLQPGYTKAVFRRLFCLGTAAFLQEDLDESLKNFNAALELDPTNAIVKQEVRKVATAVEVIKAKERAAEIEKEMAVREALRAEEKEKERKMLEEKRMRDEQIRKEKAEKAEQERLERARIKAERLAARSEKEKALAEEKEREKEEKKAEKEKEKALREQEKVEERERRRLEREKERIRLKEEKEKKEREDREAAEKERLRKLEFAMEMNRVRAVIQSTSSSLSSAPAAATASVTAIASSLLSTPSSKPADAAQSDGTTPDDDDSTPVDSNADNDTGSPRDSDHATAAASAAASEEDTPVVTAKAAPSAAKITSIASAISASVQSSAAKKPVSVASPPAAAAATSPAPAPAAAPAPPAELTLPQALKMLTTAVTVAGPTINTMMDCPQARVGIVIGTKGAIINDMMKKSGCKMVINQDYPDGHPRDVVFTGTKEQIEAAKVLVNAVIVHGPNILSSPEVIAQAAAAATAAASAAAPSRTRPSQAHTAHAAASTTAAVHHSATAAQAAPAAAAGTAAGPAPGVIRMAPARDLDREERRKKLLAVTPLPQYEFDTGEKVCIICSEPMRDSERLMAFGACNHKGACSVCLVRMRALGGDFACPMCRQEMQCIVCTSQDAPFKDFQLPGNPSADLTYLQKGRVFLPKTHFNDTIAPLWECKCKKCQKTFKDVDELRTHYEAQHDLTQCALCAQHKQAFPCEQVVYTMAEFDVHMREGGIDGSEGHPECAFCITRFYDKTELYKHVTKEHFTCTLCQRDNAQYKYYRDYRMLEQHYRSEHFMCDERECQEKKHIVFRSLFDLQAHKRAAHSIHSSGYAPTIGSGISGAIVDAAEEFPALGTNPSPRNPRRQPGPSTSSVPATLNSEEFPALTPQPSSSRQQSASASSGATASVSARDTGFSSSSNISGFLAAATSGASETVPSSLQEVDFSVLRELPVDIQRELLSSIGRADAAAHAAATRNEPIQPQTSSPRSAALSSNFFDNAFPPAVPSSVSNESHFDITASAALLAAAGREPSPPPRSSSLGISGLSGLMGGLDMNTYDNPTGSFGTTGLGGLGLGGLGGSDIFGSMGLGQSSGGLGSASTKPAASSRLAKLGMIDDLDDDAPLDFNASLLSGLGDPFNPSASIAAPVTSTAPLSTTTTSGLGGLGFGGLGSSSIDALPGLSPLADPFNPSSFGIPGAAGVGMGAGMGAANAASSSAFGVGGGAGDMNLSSSLLSLLGSGSSQKPSAAGANAPVAPGFGGLGGLSGGLSAPFSVPLVPETSDENDAAEGEEDDMAAFAASEAERALFDPTFVDRLIEVLRRCGPDGILGAQFPDAYRKMFGEKLNLENRKGRKVKLVHILNGHPNAHRDKTGIVRWYYREAGAVDFAAKQAASVLPALNEAIAGINKAKAAPAKAAAAAAAAAAKPAPAVYNGPPGIEVDLLPHDSFPSVAWLRDYDMHMYRWAGNEFEWTEYAMRLRPDIAAFLEAPGVGDGAPSAALAILRKRSGCDIYIDVDNLYGKQEKFLVFVRGDTGKPSNAAMSVALDAASQMFRIRLQNVPKSSSSISTVASASADTDDDEDDDDEAHAQAHLHGGSHHGRIQHILDIPQSAVGLIAGKNGKKLHAMRKKSGAYIALVSKSRKVAAKLTISGVPKDVEVALSMVRQALSEPDEDAVEAMASSLLQG